MSMSYSALPMRGAETPIKPIQRNMIRVASSPAMPHGTYSPAPGYGVAVRARSPVTAPSAQVATMQGSVRAFPSALNGAWSPQRPSSGAYCAAAEPIAMAAPTVCAGPPDPYHPPQRFLSESAPLQRPVPTSYVQDVYGVTYCAPPANNRDASVHAELATLRIELEESAKLVSDWSRRGTELMQQNAELERLLSESEAKLCACDGDRSALRSDLQSDERAIASREDELAQLQFERDRCQMDVQDLNARNDVLEAEAQEFREQEEELRRMNDEQAQRNLELDERVGLLERELGNRQLEIESLLRTNDELEERLHAEGDRVAELEALVEELQSRPTEPLEPYAPLPSPTPPAHATSEEEIIDQHIQQFFMANQDFQLAVSKEKPGLYRFDHPINKKVNMKVQGEKVLARVGGGWQVMEEWLGQERQHFMEAQDMEERLEEALPPPAQERAAPARASLRASATATTKAAAKAKGAARRPTGGSSRTGTGGARAAGGGSRTEAHQRDQF